MCKYVVRKTKGRRFSMRIVYSYFVLDLIHSGHLYYMEQAKSIAGLDGLSVVGILTDEATMEKKKKPLLPLSERMKLAQSVECNDVVIAQETYSPIENIRRLKPDFVLESTSHSDELIKEVTNCVESMKGRVIVIPYTDAYEYSSSSIKKGGKKNE